MDSVPFSSSANVIGVATGSTSILGLFVAFYRAHLPSSKYKGLEQLVGETESIYNSIVEANLLLDSQFREDVRSRLAELREEMYEHRQRAYGATTLLQQYKEFFKGLSISIARTSGRVKTIRALVITTSEAERRRLRTSTGMSNDSSSYPVDDYDRAEGVNQRTIENQNPAHVDSPSRSIQFTNGERTIAGEAERSRLQTSVGVSNAPSSYLIYAHDKVEGPSQSSGIIENQSLTYVYPPGPSRSIRSTKDERIIPESNLPLRSRTEGEKASWLSGFRFMADLAFTKEQSKSSDPVIPSASPRTPVPDPGPTETVVSLPGPTKTVVSALEPTTSVAATSAYSSTAVSSAENARHGTYSRMNLNNYLQGRYGSTRMLTWQETTYGPSHAPIWTSIAYVNKVEYGRASHHLRGAAREEAARIALEAIQVY